MPKIDWNQAEQRLFNRALVQEVRVSKGISKKALAQAIGVAPTTISNIEGATRTRSGDLHGCKTDTLLKIADFLDIAKQALDPPAVPENTAKLTIATPRTINFRSSAYPGDGQADDIWRHSSMMMIMCPLTFKAPSQLQGQITIERVMASVSFNRTEYMFELRSWADLMRGGPMLKRAQELLMQTRSPSSAKRSSEERRGALAAADQAWAARAVSNCTGTSQFVPFQLSEENSNFSMEACFRAVDKGITWENFIDAIDPDEPTQERLSFKIAALTSTNVGTTSHSLTNFNIETRCLRRIKRWIESRTTKAYIPRHIQPRVIEGTEEYCGREGHCCFDVGDECKPERS